MNSSLVFYVRQKLHSRNNLKGQFQLHPSQGWGHFFSAKLSRIRANAQQGHWKWLGDLVFL